MIAALFLLLQASQPQSAPVSAEAVSSTHAFIDCLHAEPMQAQSVRLERSGASTTDFYMAAQTSCGGQWRDAHRALVASYKARYSGSPEKDPRKAATDLLIAVVDKEWREISMAIAKQRAGKKSN